MSAALTSAEQSLLAWAKLQSPGAILQKLNAGGKLPSGAALGTAVSAADALASSQWQVAQQAQENKGLDQSKIMLKAVGGIYAALGAAPLGALAALWSLLPDSFLRGINLSGPFITCSAARGAAVPLLTPQQLYESPAGVPWPITPRTLASVVVPVLCQGFFDLEQCLGLDPTSMSWAALGSNVTIASMTHLYNQQAAGGMVDYFVPYVPSFDATNHGFGVWGGKGLREAGWSPWLAPPPFVIPGQAQYAFWPLASVPASVADPSTEFHATDGSPGSPAPGYPWSRITARAGPLPTATQRTVSTVAKVAVGAGLAAALGPALLKWATGKSAEVLLEQALAAIADL